MKANQHNGRIASYGLHGEGAEMAYAIVDSALGRLLVAGTRRGICFAALGEADPSLVSELRSDYPRATIRVADPNRRADESIGRTADALAAYVGGRAKMPSPRMDIRGTAFQCAVWQQLRAIPAGETRSYSEIAQRIGRPRAIRAVGTANGANPVSIVIPCHRAVRASGHLGGYRWGLERKRKLLAMEGYYPEQT
ncbi:MAG TPA: methylated-DNA--[protein]-cysteine S-methyltransferase [Patescibacteria group bacterium]|nr:methylated-DNA--[protein]-cysteine S-methyltransferase [Patescibacteria group bacterium]